MAQEPGIAISQRFWRTLTSGEFSKIVGEQNGCLNAEQCARLWRLEEYNTEPPRSLLVWVKKDDVEKLIEDLKNAGGTDTP